MKKCSLLPSRGFRFLVSDCLVLQNFGDTCIVYPLSFSLVEPACLNLLGTMDNGIIIAN